MLSTTFLCHFKPLCKTFEAGVVTPYPLAKNFTSVEIKTPITHSGVAERFKAITDHAAMGSALLKGPLTEPLENTSRAGKCDKHAASHTIVFDFDGMNVFKFASLETPYSKTTVENIAEHLVKTLPATFHKSTYIAHASSSLGLKGGKVSMHIEFFLETPIAPTTLRMYLTSLNFSIPSLDNEIGLSASGTALTFKLDPALAENSRIIYIGNPIFKDCPNPIDDDARLLLVQKENVTVNISNDTLNLNNPTIERQKKAKRKILRNLLGLDDATFKNHNIKTPTGNASVVANPDQVAISFYSDYENIVCYNVNNGDSHAYYVDKSCPQIVWNFKGEPPFNFEVANKEMYQWHLDTFPVAKGGTAVTTPFAFRDFSTNAYFNGIYDRTNKCVLEIASTSRLAITDYIEQHGGIASEKVETWKYVFAPQDPRTFEPQTEFINKYVEPDITKNKAPIPMDAQSITYGNAAPVMAKYFPFIHNTMMAALGSDLASFEHFINWLAFIVKYKEKTGTAWVLNGIGGTGKGVLHHNIIAPLLGRQYTPSIRTETATEKFNKWMEEALVVQIDEFAAKNAGTETRKFLDKLKNLISEPYISIRAMGENSTTFRNYSNFILTTNLVIPILIDKADRRFNISPRQENTIESLYPGYKVNFEEALTRELPLFATFCCLFNVNKQKAKTVLENSALHELKLESRTPTEIFADALKGGDIAFLCELFESEWTTDSSNMAASNSLKALIRDLESGGPRKVKITSKEMTAMYSVLVRDISTPLQVGRILGQHGLKTKAVSINNFKVKAFVFNWNVDPQILKTMQHRYLNHIDIDITRNEDLIEHFKTKIPELWPIGEILKVVDK